MLPEELIREVKRLEIYARRRVDDLFAGEYHAAFRGQGIEFAEVREYEPGDDVRSIDWNVTARAGRPFIKRFIEERRLTVLLCLDTSASHAFGTISKSKARVAAEVASVLAMVATRSNDRVGLITFADAVKLFVPPRKGRTHLLRVIRECLDTSATGGGAGLSEAMDLVRTVVRQHAIVFLLSDFLFDPQREAAVLGALRMASHRHEVVGVRISDPRELELPPIGLVKMVDPETRRTVLVDTGSRATRQRFQQAAAQQRQVVDRLFRAARSDLIDVSTAKPFGTDLLRYFRARERRR